MTKEISTLSYEAAREELQQVVSQLEQQNVSLEASMALWERGEALAAHCEGWLSGARKKLDETIATKDSK
ncbi:exodeoxyribonuclease VII small subunit [Candidatus Aquiluna sp. UB-MaderosW2red]|uniref:exodeoxyribonuclease VII small subunit n=1 Tax=Candidatus Aquiluna sp. UB-MaderosW2red TaxID=1855377 RepID=UPI000875EFD9|nr:exodeoxyribonuclease VII small subunit [Candidatus Aquiluna sp. UB-MaderosW2red]SCX08902.1 exodeoxyribonuclease VII small subunit [Candidatus Aquiluna sp. UB-MaderosW2red]